MNGRQLVVALCIAEILGMAGFSCFAALLPELARLWDLSSIEAGWISGIFYAGYTLAVPLLVSLTDSVDPRRIYLGSTLLGGAAWLGFLFLADGFWSALVCQAIAGMGLAGTYMPGLKALTDRMEGPAQTRAVAFYTSCFGIGASLSFVVAGQAGALLGWRAAFAVAAVGSLLSFALAASVLKRRPATGTRRPLRAALDFRPILRNRRIMARVIAYAAHNWELFGVRSWIVAFLAFCEAQAGARIIDPTLVAAAMTVVGLPASVGGNELSLRFGRIRTIVCVMAVSATLSATIGFAAGLLPLGVLFALCLVYGGTIAGESASLTASVVAEADPALRGATMALYSTIGFVGAFLGPLAFGTVLDVAGSDHVAGWGIAFASLGAALLLGPLTMLTLGRRTP